jgi:hypothetical protein
MTPDQQRAMSVYAALACSTSYYAYYLESLKKSYEPHGTIWTVVGGNTLLGMGFLGICLLAPPRNPMDAFWHLVLVNLVGGTPIAIWQLWQRWNELQQQRARPRVEL